MHKKTPRSQTETSSTVSLPLIRSAAGIWQLVRFKITGSFEPQYEKILKFLLTILFWFHDFAMNLQILFRKDAFYQRLCFKT